MKKLLIISPKGGVFDTCLRLSCIFKKRAVTSNYSYFTYIGELSPLEEVCELLSSFDFKQFSLDKETNYYILKVHVE